MKAIKNIRLILALAFMAFVINACVQDDDFQAPVVEIEEPDVNVSYTLKEIKDSIANSNGQPFVIKPQSATPVYVEAYIASDDESGNIYQRVYVQDQPENPEVGMAISTFATDVYPVYSQGRKVYIRVDGLAAASSNGMPTIGAEADPQYGVSRIDQDTFEERVLISSTVEEIVPTEVTISELQSDQYLATLVKLNDVQFANPDQNYTSNNQTTNVTIEDCDENTTYLRNSNYADFAETPLPNGNGSVVGIAAVFNVEYQLFINSAEDVNFQGERCGEEPEGPTGPAGIIEIPFTENFETLDDGSEIALEGWTNYAETGSVRWEAFSDSDNEPSMGIGAIASAYQSGDTENVMWLITPGMDFDAQEDEVLTFKTSNSYSDDSDLEVLISTDWDGNQESIASATWESVNGANIVSDDEFFTNVINSGNIDLSSYSGTGYIAFRYTGGQSTAVDGTYELDDVSVSIGEDGGEEGGENTIFEDTFANGFANWSTYDAAGAQEWEISQQFGNPAPSAIMSGYDGGNNTNEDWLISEAIDLSGVSSASFSFDNVRNFSGNPIEVYYSTNYNGGNPNVEGDWVQLSPTLDTDTSGFGDWVNSGDLDVSAAAGGDLYVAFKYTSTTSASTTIEIDNIIVQGE